MLLRRPSRLGRPHERPLALAVVHLPPPVHGLARASESVVAALERAAPGRVAVADISGSLEQGPLGHIGRIGRVLAAAYAIVRHRRCGRLYLACDGGVGVAFTAGLLELAARLGYEIHLHHHSLAQVRLPHATAPRLLARASQRHRDAVVHVGACPEMVGEIAEVYGPGTEVFVLPLHQASEMAPPMASGTRTTTAFVLGHLSNLTEAKGLGTVFDLLARGTAEGLDLELVVAGPAHASSDRQILERGLEEAGGRAQWLGPVGGEAKSAFFAQIDAFVFPSRYQHESFAIVVAEAQAAGRPVLAHKAGCLDSAVFGTGVQTFPIEADFVPEALDRIRGWIADRDALDRLSSDTAAQALQNRAAADEALTTLAQRVCQPPAQAAEPRRARRRSSRR